MVNCMVLWCPNKGTINGISYFRLTKRRHHMWMRALGRDPTIETMNKNNVVCSIHFLESDKYTKNIKIQLRENAIPRLKLKKSTSFHTPGRLPKRAKEWSITAGREDLLYKVNTLHKGYRICQVYFEKKIFLTPECKRLLAHAKPTIFSYSESKQSINQHTYSAVQTRPLENTLSSQSEDISLLEDTIPSTTLILQSEDIPMSEETIISSSDTDDLLLHHEIEIKTEPISSTSFQSTNTVSTQTQNALPTVDESEKSLKRQIKFLMNDNYRLIRQIKDLDVQLETKRSQILKNLSLDEFKDILKTFNDSEQQPDELDDGEDENVVKWEDVAVKVEDESKWEDVAIKVEDESKWEDVAVKVEEESKWDDVEVKVEDAANWEEVLVKVEDIEKMETEQN